MVQADKACLEVDKVRRIPQKSPMVVKSVAPVNVMPRILMRLEHFLRRFGVDLTVALGLGLFALALRVPFLYEIPRWTDEVGEAVTALRIAQGGVTPLLGMVPYYGPVHADLLALVLKFYQDPLVPRAFNLVVGALTVTATFFFGLALHNRLAGVLAALLLAASSTHIVVNSHLAYGSAATPFYSTIACIFLLLARSRNSAWLLGAAGVFFSLAVQTHPVAVAMAPGLLLWFLLPRSQWSWFRRPGLYLAGLATALAYSPVIIQIALNLHVFQSSIISRSYAITTNHSLGTYLGNLQNLIVELLRMVGAHYGGASRPLLYLTDPIVLAFALLVPAACIVALRRGRSLPVFVLASSGLIVPYYLGQFEDFPYFTRYVAFMLPVIYVLVASLAVQVWESFQASPLLSHTLMRRGSRVLVCTLSLALMAVPLQRTFEYYGRQVQSESTNAPFLAMVRYIENYPEANILIDGSLREGEFPSGGNLSRAFRVWFDFDKRTREQVDIQKNVPVGICSGKRLFLIASPAAAGRLGVDCHSFRILSYEIPTRPGRGDLEYGLYQIGPSD